MRVETNHRAANMVVKMKTIAEWINKLDDHVRELLKALFRKNH